MEYQEYLTKKRDYQYLGHEFLLDIKHGCLNYKPGKGKTYPCIDAIRDIDKSLNGNAKVLILSTATSVKKMWEEEIVPQNILPKNTIIVSYNSAIVDNTRQRLLKIKWDVIVADECHKIKSHNTKSSKLVYQLTKKCKYVFGLTGTPRGNSDVDIYCQFHNLNIGEWGKISYTQFIDQVCDIDQKFFHGAMIKVPIGINQKYRAGWERNISMYTQRVDYDEDDNMPELNTTVHKISFVPSKEYLAAEKGVLSCSDYETTLTKLAVIGKLQQAANGFMYIPNDDGDNKIVRFQHNNKLDWLVDNLNNEPTVIVYKFQADFADIQLLLGTKGITSTDDITSFKTGKYNILLLQCSQCDSYNLQMCNRIIFYTMDYSFINFDQMCKRVWRMGQTKPVQVDILIADNTMEEKVWKIVNNKQKLADLFFAIKSGV